MRISNSQSNIDTIQVYNYCLEGVNCVNHNHGIIDTTFYYYANIGTSKSYFKVMPSEVDASVDCKNLYKDVFGNLFYMDPEVKQEKKEFALNSFDTIKVGDKVFPAATPFVPHYHTHAEAVKQVSNNYDHVVDIASLPILVLMTIAYASRAIINNSWSKFFSELSST